MFFIYFPFIIYLVWIYCRFWKPSWCDGLMRIAHYVPLALLMFSVYSYFNNSYNFAIQSMEQGAPDIHGYYDMKQLITGISIKILYFAALSLGLNIVLMIFSKSSNRS